MGAGEFAQGHGHCPVDKGGCEKAEDGSGTSNLHGRAGPEKQSGTDRAADGNHGHLRGGELAAEPFFVELQRSGGLRRHAAT